MIKKKSIVIFTILITIINTLMPVVNAVSEITKANLINDHKIDSHIMYYNEERKEWRNIQCNYICYKIDGEKYPAYCITHGVNGVDEEGSYTVTINDLLKDELVYNTIINGYPYKTPAQLGVETRDDAYVATKHAVNSVLLNRDVKSFYKASDSRGEKIINAIYEITEKGKAGKSSNKPAEISINKIGDLIESGNYYYQEYSVNADVNIAEYTVKSIESFPEGSYVADNTGTNKTTFSSSDKFRIMIPKTKLDKDIYGEIKIVAECNTNPIFYGKAPKSNIQDYAVTYKPYVSYEDSTTFNKFTNTSSIKIIKQDVETSKPIKDVVFGLYKENEEYITSGKTNSEGIVIFSNLYKGTYKIKELTANENYEKDETVYEMNTEYGKTVSRTITNTHKKGNLKITKIDKDENNVVLEGIEFDLIDVNNKVVAHLLTNEKGIAQIDGINIGRYTIKETKTRENYNLCIDNNIEVKWNNTTEITIENEKKKGQIQIIKQDKENNQIKLEGVKFQIIDGNNKVVDEINTNSNGVAITKRLPIGEYTIKEINLGENIEYILEHTEYKTEIKDKKITEIVVENMHKKGNLKITKVDKDDKTITLGAIEFELIDKNGNTIAHLVTDVNGEAYIENINTGAYTLKETVTKREYNLCENKDIVVEWNKTSDIVIENEKKKGQIQIVKQDAEKEEIKLEGVKFQILDINNKVIEEIITDNKGEAMSSRLLIGEYAVKEIDLGNNTNYLINNESYNIQVENEKVTKLVVKNEHKKGKLQINKVDKDDWNIILEGVKFEITDEDGFRYETITNKEGIAIVENIRSGKIKIKEIQTNEQYELLEKELEAQIKFNETTDIIIENEKIKGQVEIYKTDKDDSNIKIPNVKFEIVDENNKLVDEIATNENGYVISKRLPVGKYYLKEVKTDSKYVLNEETIKINIEGNKILKLEIKNEKVKGKIQIIKTSSNDSPILDIKQGQVLEDVEFEIFNSNNELVDILITDDQGQAISKDLEIGRYKIKEKRTNEYYILNDNEFVVNIEMNNEVKVLEIRNEAVVPKLDVEIFGQDVAEKNEEIKYEFEIKNKSNTKLDNFTWKEYIPYEDSKVTKMVTGIYNENLEYKIYYKTNQNDYRLFKNANSSTSEYLSFDELKLSEKEIITEIKVEYKTVSKDFAAVVKPIIFTKIDNDVQKDDKIINNTNLSGNIEDYVVRDRSNFETVIKEKEIVKKLPKTGC